LLRPELGRIVTFDGGEKAAFGFRYQYLVTVEDFLRYLVTNPDQARSASLVIEAAGPSEDDDDDVIDYSIVVSDAVAQRVQVKGTRNPTGRNPFRPGEAKAVFDRMLVGPRAATPGVVRTNKPASKKLSTKWKSTTHRDISLTRYDYPQLGNDAVELAVECDHRSTQEVKQSVLSLIKQIRKDKAIGQGAKSAALLMAVVLDRVFDSAAGLSQRTIHATELLELLGTHDNALAHALGEFDWGAPLVEVPRLASQVARAEELVELSNLFDDSVSTRTPTVAVRYGITGFGKTTLAADFCHLNRHLYEKVVWIDCRKTHLIEGKVQDVLRRLDVEFDAASQLPELFQTALGNLAGPVVVIFDGAYDREQIERFIPTSGCGFVLVTTANSTSWSPSVDLREIGAFSPEEAVRCFARYANIAVDEHFETISAIVERLERVPLAVAMAGLYFRDSGDDVANLKDDYFARLDALDDDAFRPDYFDLTAFAAVRLAAERLGEAKAGSTGDRLQAQQIVRNSCFLAPELIPFNLILQAVAQADRIDLDQPPRPEVADQHQRNVIMATLQTQTIARRRRYVESAGHESAASDTLNLHPLVHEILRSINTDVMPQRDLVGILTGLIGCVYGWLEEMRAHGDFFPVDQLLFHSDHLLSVIDDLSLTDAPGDELGLYRCAAVLLRCEAANAHSSRGQYGESVAMIEQALADVTDLQLTPKAQALITKAAADALADVVLGGLGVKRAVPIAQRELEELRKLEAVDLRAKGEMVYLCADESIRALGNFESAETDALAAQTADIAGRQTRSPSTTGMAQAILADIKTGRLHQALSKIEQARRAASTAPDQTFVDQQEATVRLHLHQFDQAADAIERIIAADRSRHLAFAFRSIYIVLNTGLTHERPRWLRSRAADRLTKLHAEVVARMSA
jgi:tetratricopeptide (TPR) repeat protein